MTSLATRPVTHKEAKRIVAKYGVKKIIKFARKGERDPLSITDEQFQAVAAYVWLNEMAKRN